MGFNSGFKGLSIQFALSNAVSSVLLGVMNSKIRQSETTEMVTLKIRWSLSIGSRAVPLSIERPSVFITAEETTSRLELATSDAFFGESDLN